MNISIPRCALFGPRTRLTFLTGISVSETELIKYLLYLETFVTDVGIFSSLIHLFPFGMPHMGQPYIIRIGITHTEYGYGLKHLSLILRVSLFLRWS